VARAAHSSEARTGAAHRFRNLPLLRVPLGAGDAGDSVLAMHGPPMTPRPSRTGIIQPYGHTLPAVAVEILRLLNDGEWHEIGSWHSRTARRLVASGLIFTGECDGLFLAVATDAGLARIKPRALAPIINPPMTHPMVRP
jgi:hypothetical protein